MRGRRNFTAVSFRLQGAVICVTTPTLMIRLFVSDIDECLSQPFRPYALPELAALSSRVIQAGAHGEWPLPAFSLLSGRAYAYVEAMSQLLGTEVPVLFESGAGMFDRVKARTLWHPALHRDHFEAMELARKFVTVHVVPAFDVAFDFGKRTQVGVISANESAIVEARHVMADWVRANTPNLTVFSTGVSVDILPIGVTKAEGIAWLAEMVDLPLAQIAYIGDSEGDLGALQRVGWSFAPFNAAPAVKAQVRTVTRMALAPGVLEAYELCVSHNRSFD